MVDVYNCGINIAVNNFRDSHANFIIFNNLLIGTIDMNYILCMRHMNIYNFCGNGK